jgi:AcrR family transcriptional regulator
MARPAQIDRAAVLAASMAIADDRGLAAVTMQAVADRLGVTAMALYRHVANKADLLDGLVEALLTEFSLPSAELPWAERMSAIGQAVRATARRHPDVFGLLLLRSATTPAAVRVRDEIYVALREAGVAQEEIPRVERLVSTMVLGFAASEAGGRFAGHSAAEIDADFADLERIIEQMLQTRGGVAAARSTA